MKRVLIITYNFPPVGGGSVIRVAKFVKYLQNFGWQPVILTKSQIIPNTDNELLNEIPKNVIIYRTKLSFFEKYVYKLIRKINPLDTPPSAGPPEKSSDFRYNIIKILQKIRLHFINLLYFPDQYIFWSKKNFEYCRQIIKNEKIDIIFTTSPPHSIHFLGGRLKRVLKITWVADFRDSWTNNPLFSSKNPYYRKKADLTEKSIMKNADLIITATKPIEQYYSEKYQEILRKKIITITNGFDPSDYPLRHSLPNNQNLVITYTGSVGGKRSTQPLYLALKDLKTDNPEVFKILSFNFIGLFYDSKISWKKLLGDSVNFIPFCSHQKCIKFMMASDVLLLIFHSSEGGNLVYTGKIFEYLAAQRPILGIIPDGIAKDLIIKNKIGYTANPNNVKEIKNILINIYNKWLNKKLFFRVNNQLLDQFNRKNLTQQLSETFNRVYLVNHQK